MIYRNPAPAVHSGTHLSLININITLYTVTSKSARTGHRIELNSLDIAGYNFRNYRLILKVKYARKIV